jgi:aspartyl-tRNA(Asn)/glutamyl-tRNA(Gln) amidotransferase subunit A
MRSTARRSSTARPNGYGTPIGSHLTPNDPGYVDLTGEYPHDPAKAKALLKEAGVTTPLQLTLTCRRRLRAQGRRDHRGRTGRGRHRGEDRERRMGAVAVGRLQGQEFRPDDHQPRRAARHRIYANPDYYFPVRQPRPSATFSRSTRRARPRRLQAAIGDAQRKLADDCVNVFLFQLPQSPWPTPSSRAVEELADLRQRPVGAVLAMSAIPAPLHLPRPLHAEDTELPCAARDHAPARAPPSQLLRRLSRSRACRRRGDLARAGARRAFEPHIHATYLLEPERGARRGRASEARWLRGAPIGPLDGVPATVKDNIATRATRARSARRRATLTPAPRRRAARGAAARGRRVILFAKTTMPDYGMLSSGLSSFHPLTRNPWDLAAIPAARRPAPPRGAAAGYGPLHMSAPTSAARCGCPPAGAAIFGLKPSAGRIPIDPPYIGRVAGPMTRTVADAALMMATLSAARRARFDEPAAAALDWQRRAERDCGPAHRAAAGRRLRRLAADARGARRGRGAARDFEAAGAIVEPLAPFLTQAMLDGLDRFWRMRCGSTCARCRRSGAPRSFRTSRLGARRRKDLSGEVVFRRLQPDSRAMRERGHGDRSRIDFVLSPTVARSRPFPPSSPSPSERPAEPIRSRTSPSRSPTT